MKTIDYQTAEGALLTDQYQLTMAQLYYHQGMHELNAQFDYFYRKNPDYGSHAAGFCVSAGLEWFLDWLAHARFREKDIEFLAGQKDSNDKRLFDADFLNWLSELCIADVVSIRAIPEGRVIHPNTPLAVVHGPLAACQLIETSLLNRMNYQTLIATKAARIRQVINSSMLLEFGARRGADRGTNAGARAALIGGADFTSNVGISHTLGYPPKGTHAHSMVQAFLALGMSEYDAFKAYAETYPDGAILLVDTINTLESGVPNAIRVFQELRAKGHRPVGIRIDSGDLAFLAIQAAKMLDNDGFEDVSIILSNDLDELTIWQILQQISREAPQYGVDADHLISRLVYGVGTRLITSAGSPSLGGVFKLVALQNGNEWQPALKLSENTAKIPNPGNKQVWRLYDANEYATADLISIHDEEPDSAESLALYHSVESTKTRTLQQSEISGMEPLLQDMVTDGSFPENYPSIEEMRHLGKKDTDRLHPGVKRLMNPHIYHVSLSKRMWNMKQDLIRQLQESIQDGPK